MLLSASVFSSDKVARPNENKIKYSSHLKNLTEKVSQNDLDVLLKDFLKAARPSRVLGSKGHSEAREFIRKKLLAAKGNNIQIYEQDFNPDFLSAAKMYEADFNREIVGKFAPTDPNYKKWKGFTLSMINGMNELKNHKGMNFIWEKKGTINPEQVLILGANYDTINNDPKTLVLDIKSKMPGADNNGTGVVYLLKLIETLKDLDLPKTIKIVFFDAEELGFLGSKFFVESLNQSEKIIGYLNFVMLGNDSRTSDTDKRLGNMKAYIRNPNVEADKSGAIVDLELANKVLVLPLKNSSGVSFEITANSMNSSSHIKFWEKGIPAVCFTQNWDTDFNPRYHTPNDFSETLNMTTYHNSFKYLSLGILGLLFDIVK